MKSDSDVPLGTSGTYEAFALAHPGLAMALWLVAAAVIIGLLWSVIVPIFSPTSLAPFITAHAAQAL